MLSINRPTSRNGALKISVTLTATPQSRGPSYAPLEAPPTRSGPQPARLGARCPHDRKAISVPPGSRRRSSALSRLARCIILGGSVEIPAFAQKGQLRGCTTGYIGGVRRRPRSRDVGADPIRDALGVSFIPDPELPSRSPSTPRCHGRSGVRRSSAVALASGGSTRRWTHQLPRRALPAGRDDLAQQAVRLVADPGGEHQAVPGSEGAVSEAQRPQPVDQDGVAVGVG